MGLSLAAQLLAPLVSLPSVVWDLVFHPLDHAETCTQTDFPLEDLLESLRVLLSIHEASGNITVQK